MSKREQRRAARKSEMLDAAMKIVLERGLEAFTIARLAEELGAAVGAIYRYCPSKEAVLVGLQIRAVEGFRDQLVENLGRADEWIAKQEGAADTGHLLKVLLLLESYLEDGERAPTRHRLLDTLLSRPDPILDATEASEVFAAILPLLSCVTSVLRAPVEAGVLSEGDDLQRGLLLFASVHGLDHFRKHDRFQAPNYQVSVLSLELFRAWAVGWGASPEQAKKAVELYHIFVDSRAS